MQEQILTSAPSAAPTETPLALVTQALGVLASAAVVLDASLRIVALTPSAQRLLGAPALGSYAVKVLGESAALPLGEALAQGRSVSTTMTRPAGDGERIVRVRAMPLYDHTTRTGWLVVLAEERDVSDVVPESLGTMWTRDPVVKRLFTLASKVAQCDAHVLLDGETGTGKASFAAAIHACSTRQHGPFRALPCASATNEALERALLAGAAGSELTLFLDEVTELSASAQARLLRALDGGVVTPLDGAAPQKIDVRVIAATRTSLNDEIARGRFRADLAYKLRVVSLHLPPLRSRHGDVALLVDKLIETLNARGGRRVERIAPNALTRLERHDWPGNVRELCSAIESAFVVGEGPVLSEGDLPRDLVAPDVTEVTVESVNHGSDEKARIQRALDASSGDRLRAAAMLGMSRTTLWRRMRVLGLLEA